MGEVKERRGSAYFQLVRKERQKRTENGLIEIQSERDEKEGDEESEGGPMESKENENVRLRTLTMGRNKKYG
jgi:hypothetical protein